MLPPGEDPNDLLRRNAKEEFDGLLQKAVDPVTFQITMLATSPVPISTGGDYLDGRIYFGSGSHVYSYAVAE